MTYYTSNSFDDYELPHRDSYAASSVSGDFEELKQDQIRKSIDDIVQLIDERTKVREQNLSKIEESILEAENNILQWDNFQPGMNKAIDKMKADMNREVFNLEKQKRDEHSHFWKDTLKLREQLNYLTSKYTELKARTLFTEG